MTKEATPTLDVLVAIPTSDGYIEPETLHSYDRMLVYMENKGHRLGRFRPRRWGSILPAARCESAQAAIAYKAKWLMFIDADMVFPPDAVLTLIDRGKNVIGGMYFTKNKNATPLVARRVGNNSIRFDDWPKDRIYKCDEIGTGFMLINTSVFNKLKMPYFMFDYYEGAETGSGGWIGEDYYFCRKYTEGGGQVWCDPTFDLGHVGTTIYSKYDCAAYQDSALVVPKKEIEVVKPKIEVVS